MAKTHVGAVTPISAKEMDEHLERRLTAITLPKTFSSFVFEGEPPVETPNPEYEAKVEYETTRAQEGWAATCSCGWAGNNPHSSEEDARAAVDHHFSLVNEPEGLV